MKRFLKQIIHAWPWPLTLNERYDRQTSAVIKKVCKEDSHCIDIGCFKGDILRQMIGFAPKGKHIAFEPIPSQFEMLRETFGNTVTFYPYALGSENAQATFHHVVSNPTYSGLKQRAYKQDEKVIQIPVEVRRLDDVLSPDQPVHLIKIDVEGGELDVLKGAARTLDRWHPYIIFEHGIGGADKYNSGPADIYSLLAGKHGYKLGLMGNFLQGQEKGFTSAAFEEQFWKRKNCYFIAF